jgi:hypothetical protein
MDVLVVTVIPGQDAPVALASLGQDALGSGAADEPDALVAAATPGQDDLEGVAIPDQDVVGPGSAARLQEAERSEEQSRREGAAILGQDVQVDRANLDRGAEAGRVTLGPGCLEV